MGYKVVLPVIIIVLVIFKIAIDIRLHRKGKKRFDFGSLLILLFFLVINVFILVFNLNHE